MARQSARQCVRERARLRRFASSLACQFPAAPAWKHPGRGRTGQTADPQRVHKVVIAGRPRVRQVSAWLDDLAESPSHGRRLRHESTLEVSLQALGGNVMKRVLTVATILAITVSGFISCIGTASAQPARRGVRCGATITTNITLHHDLVNCPSNGLLIGANNITLDLNGHSIDGDDAFVDACSADEVCDVGVSNTGKYSGLTMKNGTIKHFNVGVLLDGADHNHLRHLSVVRNHLSGIVAFESDRMRVENSRIARNGLTADFAGMSVADMTGALIKDNLIFDNGDIGLLAGDSFHRGRIVGNRFSGNPEAGIVVEGSHNDVRRNRVRGGGVILGGDNNVLSKNHVLDPARCADGCGIGISLEHGTGNLIARNIVVRPPVVGIRIDAYGGPANNTIVRGNVVRNAGGDGIGVNHDHVGPVTDTLLKNNLVRGSGDDGIDVESATTALRRNVAVDNRDLGIEAVSGVTDRGGNYAARNGRQGQCTHVRCDGGR